MFSNVFSFLSHFQRVGIILHLEGTQCTWKTLGWIAAYMDVPGKTCEQEQAGFSLPAWKSLWWNWRSILRIIFFLPLGCLLYQLNVQMFSLGNFHPYAQTLIWDFGVRFSAMETPPGKMDQCCPRSRLDTVVRVSWKEVPNLAEKWNECPNAIPFHPCWCSQARKVYVTSSEGDGGRDYQRPIGYIILNAV